MEQMQRLLTWAQPCVSAGVMLGQRWGQRAGSSFQEPTRQGRARCPILPTAPRSLMGSAAGDSQHLSSGQHWPCRDPAPALGSGQDKTINHESADATCRL